MAGKLTNQALAAIRGVRKLKAIKMRKQNFHFGLIYFCNGGFISGGNARSFEFIIDRSYSGNYIEPEPIDENGLTIVLPELRGSEFSEGTPAISMKDIARNLVISDFEVRINDKLVQTRVNKSDLISGYPDGTFGAERSITRAESASLLLRVIHSDVMQKITF